MANTPFAEFRVRRAWVLPIVAATCRWWLPCVPDRWIDRVLIVACRLSATEYRLGAGQWRRLRWE